MDNIEKIISELEKGAKSFTQVKEATGLENGVLQHHINNSSKIVKKNNAIMLKDFCTTCGVSNICDDDCIQKILKNERKREIIDLIDEGLSQSEIAEKLDISKPTVNYHFNDLRDSGILEDSKITEDAKNFLKH